MKKGIHPKYYEVIFYDSAADFKFLSRSTSTSKETMIFDDGKEYPVIRLDISSASHPFYTGQNKLIDSEGRIDKFRKKYQKVTK
jgi:large subunit ribosomal protein L31